jgi:hypothetical protein
VDEAVELLTGLPAGKRQPDGAWEEGTVNYKVNQTLTRLMELARELMKGEEEGKSGSPPPSPASCKG